MKKFAAKLAIPVLLIVILLLAITAVASANSPQMWRLDSDQHSPVVSQKVMWKGILCRECNSDVPIAAGSWVTWLADQHAEGNVVFPNTSGQNVWVTTITTDSCWGTSGPFGVICWADEFRVEIGEYDVAGTFNAFTLVTPPTFKFGATIPALGIGTIIVEFDTQDGAAEVPDGHYLALRIYNDDGIQHTVYTDGRSSLVSPIADPGYPIPEITAGVLFGLGFIGLAGYLVVKRARSKAKT